MFQFGLNSFIISNFIKKQIIALRSNIALQVIADKETKKQRNKEKKKKRKKEKKKKRNPRGPPKVEQKNF